MQTLLRNEILKKIATPGSTNEAINSLFRYQCANNALYGRFVELLGEKEIYPFLPVSFFKSHEIKSGNWSAETWFESSGTTGQTSSKHLVRDINWYLTKALFGICQIPVYISYQMV